MAKHRIPRSRVTSKILERAKQMNWSNYQLSNRTDISQGVFDRWKKGVCDVTISTLEVIADAFGTTPYELLREDVPENEDPILKRITAIVSGLDDVDKYSALNFLEFLESERKKRERN